MWVTGDMLKGYRLEEKLGKGSYGEVWRAVKDGKVYAVKLLSCGTTDEANEGLAEAFLLKEVEHPHIVKAHEVFLAGDGATTVCIVMTLYEGTLEELVKKGVGEKVVLQMLREVCSGLSYLHEKKQVIHRDVKPANVLVGDGGGGEKVFALGDLGLGRKVVSEEEKVTTRAGTPLFMAPEFFFGEGHYSFKADMWALGVTACLCMFGKPIVEMAIMGFHSPHPKQREKAHCDAVLLLEKHLSDKQLCTVVCALLLPDSVDRPSSTRVLEMLDGGSSCSPSPSPSPSPSRCPPNKSLLIVLAAIAHLGGEERKRLLRVAVGSGVEEVRVAAEEAFAKDGLGRVRRVEVFSSDFDMFVDADSATVFQDKGRVKVFPEHTHTNNNNNSIHHHPNQQPLSDPPVTREEEAEDEDSRDEYKAAPKLPKADLLKTFEDHTGLARVHYGCTVSPQGDALCTVNDLGAIYLYDIDTKKMLFSKRVTGGLFKKKETVFLSCDMSANGNGRLMAAAGADGYVRIWHGSRKAWQQNVMKCHTGKVFCCRFNPTGLKLATASTDKTAQILDVQTEKVEHKLQTRSDAFTCAYNKEGSMLATGGDGDSVRLWDCRDGNMTASFADTSAVWGVGFSQDGTQIITGSMTTEVVIRDLRTLRILKSLKTRKPVHTVQFIRNDKQFVSCGRDSAISVWNSSDFSLQSYTVAPGKYIQGSSYHEGKDLFLTCSRGSSTKLWKLPSDI